MHGDGMVSLGVRETTEARNVKASTKIGRGRVTRLATARSGRVKCTSPALPRDCARRGRGSARRRRRGGGVYPPPRQREETTRGGRPLPPPPLSSPPRP